MSSVEVDLTDDIMLKLLLLEDAICEHERYGLPGYTLVLIQHDSRVDVHISIDGKPCPVDIGIERAVEAALMERRA